MSQNSMIDAGTLSSSTSGLKPELAIALSSLEVHLDQELTRYRRTRSVVKQPRQVSLENHSSHQTQPVNSINTTSAKTQHPVAQVKTNTTSPDNSDLEVQKQQESNHLQGSTTQETTATSALPTPLSPSITDNSVSSIVPAKGQTKENKETLVSTNFTSTQPEDYLESSEALLRSLQEEQPKTKKTNQNDSLLSPLGIGSMLLLLLASLTLGYVVFNPQTMPQWDLNKIKFFNFNSTSPSNQETSSVSDINSPIPTSEITPISKYPNLAAREFPEVKDPNDVVGLKPKAKPTPTPKITPPQPVAITTPKTLVQPTALPTITPKVSEPEANTVIKPSADGYYYLIADNKGDDALAKAQQVVPDAYLSDGKKYIYLGALKTEVEVNKRLQQLKEQGIKARVRQP